jgi:hypothetical protein
MLCHFIQHFNPIRNSIQKVDLSRVIAAFSYRLARLRSMNLKLLLRCSDSLTGVPITVKTRSGMKRSLSTRSQAGGPTSPRIGTTPKASAWSMKSCPPRVWKTGHRAYPRCEPQGKRTQMTKHRSGANSMRWMAMTSRSAATYRPASKGAKSAKVGGLGREKKSRGMS